MPRVDAGSIWVGFPGAPGCTTTGEVCWAAAGKDTKQMRAPAVNKPIANSFDPAVDVRECILLMINDCALKTEKRVAKKQFSPQFQPDR